ncbi:MAG: type II toxin-antitoxin system VapC family toxin [Pseudomonadota bacterium]
MIGLDTNILIRYFVQDDPAQAKQATDLIEHRCTAEEPGLINLIVLCEVVWVLSTAYRYSRAAIGAVIGDLLHAAEIVVEADGAVAAALRLYQNRRIDFADALIGIRNRHLGCTVTMTFDREAATIAEFAPAGSSR